MLRSSDRVSSVGICSCTSGRMLCPVAGDQCLRGRTGARVEGCGSAALWPDLVSLTELPFVWLEWPSYPYIP